MSNAPRILLAILVIFTATPASLIADDKPEPNGNGCEKPAKTLFEWALKTDKCCPPNGNGDEKNGENGGEVEEEEPLATDRPDFTETSSTVGLGRIQLETGYTWTRDDEGGTRVRSQSYPETLIRAGIFAEWFELRLGWNRDETRTTVGVLPGETDRADDLYVGVKIALVEQKDYLPEMAVALQATIPTRTSNPSETRFFPGINLLYSWEVNDSLSVGGSTQANRAADDAGHDYLELAQSATAGYKLTEKLGTFAEWFAFFPHSAVDPETRPEHYLNAGFTYQITNNFQIDWRAGVGLNRHADDFFTGAGFGIRY